MARIGSLFVNLALEDASFIKGLNRSAAANRSAMKRMADDTRTMTNMMRTAFAGLVGSTLVRGLIDTNREFERLNSMLVTSTGSVVGASRAFAQLEKFAAETPYGVNEAAEAYIKLKNLGLDPSIESLRSFGNTAAAMGKPLNQFIEAVADAATGEFERLKGFGIKARKEGESVSFTFQGLTTKVGNNARDIQKYLLGIGNTQFAGSMDRQARTLDGAISQLQDSVAALARGIGEAGLNDLLRDVAKWMSDAASNTSDFRRAVSGAFNAVREARINWRAQEMIAEHRGDKSYLGGMINVEGPRKLKPGEEAKFWWKARQEFTLPAEAAKPDQPTGGSSGGATEGAAKAAAEAARKAKAANDKMLADQKRFVDDFRRLEGDLYPGLRARREFDENLAAIDRAAKQGLVSASDAEGLRKALREQFELAAPEAADGFTKAFGEALKTKLGTGLVGIDLSGMVESATAAAEKLKEKLDEPFRKAAEFGRSLTDNLAQGVIYSGNIGDALVNSFKAAAAEALSSGLMKMLFGEGTRANSGLLGGLFSGIGGLFGGARADGGPVAAGRAYLVGERGPEMLVPRGAGTIIPNHQLGGGGGTTINVDARGASDPHAVGQAVAAAVRIAGAQTDARFAAAGRVRLQRSNGA